MGRWASSSPGTAIATELVRRPRRAPATGSGGGIRRTRGRHRLLGRAESTSCRGVAGELRCDRTCVFIIFQLATTRMDFRAPGAQLTSKFGRC
ncbi:unnamed protein product [Urochloa humidicola]